jgi:hypothetical protein
VILLAIVALSTADTAQAKVSVSDVQLAVRALSFMDRPPGRDARVGIVYAPNSPQSVASANELQTLMGSGFRVGNTTLHPVLVRADQLASAQADILFLTEGMGAAAPPQIQRTPCVTVDIDQVRNGACMMGVSSTPRVQVFVNRKAALRAGITFAPAFRILITEL